MALFPVTVVTQEEKLLQEVHKYCRRQAFVSFNSSLRIESDWNHCRPK